MPTLRICCREYILLTDLYAAAEAEKQLVEGVLDAYQAGIQLAAHHRFTVLMSG